MSRPIVLPGDVNVDAAVRWYRKRVPGASVERCVEVYEKVLASSREAKRRRRRPCIRGCGRLTNYDSVSGVCQDCYHAEHAAQHGSPGMYQDGCRCAECREGHRHRHAEWAARVQGNPPEHGTPNAYRNYGCRCDLCRAAVRVANAYYAERRAREAS